MDSIVRSVSGDYNKKNKNNKTQCLSIMVRAVAIYINIDIYFMA